MTATPHSAGRKVSRRRRFLYSAVMLVSLYLITETLSLAVLFFRGEPWSYTGHRMHTFASDDPLHQKEYARSVIVHPYIGYVLFPQMDPASGQQQVTEYGYVDEHSPIQHKSADRVVIGIVGGSVARYVASSETGVIQDVLAQSPAFAGKSFTFVRMAVDGHKQPQQLMTLSYLLTQGAEFDIIINLDGVNDAALPESDNVEVGVNSSYPRHWGMLLAQWSDPIVSRQIGYVTHLLIQRKNQAHRFAKWSWSPTACLIWRVLSNRLNQTIIEESSKASQLSAAQLPAALGPKEHFGSKRELYDHSIEVWERSSVILSGLCQSRGIRYFHFLQPNQYLPELKPIGDDEEGMAINPNSPFRIPVQECFPLMRQRGKQLRDAGVSFTDLTQVFDSHPEPIYIDDCCHMNFDGNSIVAKAIAEAIIHEW